MPLRSAIFRACSMSVAGRRKAICTLRFLFLLSAATRRDPFMTSPRDLASADFLPAYSRPAGLAHQSASALSFLNLGIAGVLFCVGIVFTVLRRVLGSGILRRLFIVYAAHMLRQAVIYTYPESGQPEF